MCNINAKVIHDDEGIEAWGLLMSEDSFPYNFEDIPNVLAQNEGRTFTLDNPGISLKIMLKRKKSNLHGAFLDLLEVKKKVLIQLMLPGNVDFTITQTRKGWGVKLNCRGKDQQFLNDTELNNIALTSVTVGVGNSG